MSSTVPTRPAPPKPTPKPGTVTAIFTNTSWYSCVAMRSRHYTVIITMHYITDILCLSFRHTGGPLWAKIYDVFETPTPLSILHEVNRSTCSGVFGVSAYFLYNELSKNGQTRIFPFSTRFDHVREVIAGEREVGKSYPLSVPCDLGNFRNLVAMFAAPVQFRFGKFTQG